MRFSNAMMSKRYLTSDGAVQMAKDTAKKLLPGAWGVLSGAANVLTYITGILVIMLYVVFLLIDYHNMAARWRDYLPPSIRDDVSGFVEEFIQATNRYFRSQSTVSMLRGCALRDRLFHHRSAACHSHGFIHRPAEYGPLSSDQWAQSPA